MHLLIVFYLVGIWSGVQIGADQVKREMDGDINELCEEMSE